MCYGMKIFFFISNNLMSFFKTFFTNLRLRAPKFLALKTTRIYPPLGIMAFFGLQETHKLFKIRTLPI